VPSRELEPWKKYSPFFPHTNSSFLFAHIQFSNQKKTILRQKNTGWGGGGFIFPQPNYTYVWNNSDVCELSISMFCLWDSNCTVINAGLLFWVTSTKSRILFSVVESLVVTINEAYVTIKSSIFLHLVLGFWSQVPVIFITSLNWSVVLMDTNWIFFELRIASSRLNRRNSAFKKFTLFSAA